MAFCSLSCRRIDRYRKLFRFSQSIRQLNATNRTVLLIAFPSGTCNISANDTFNRKHFQLFNHHATTFKLFCLEFLRHICIVDRNHMVRNDILCEIKPKCRYSVQNSSFVRNHIRQDNIERRNSVRSYQNQLFSYIIDVPNLTFANLFHSVFHLSNVFALHSLALSI